MPQAKGSKWVARVMHRPFGTIYLGSYHTRAEAERVEHDYRVSMGMTKIEPCPECGRTRRVKVKAS